MRRVKNVWLLWLGLLALAGGLGGLLVLDIPLRNRQARTLETPEGERLSATYYPGSVSQGVLVLPGFGSDQQMMRSIVRDLVGAGLHVFTFDYPGHGSSPGALTYDNASTPRLARQVQAAMQEFQRASGLQADQITWMGHSLGARVALQSAVLGPLLPARLVLVGAQVNLGSNTQAEFFTGTSDADLEWVQALGPENPPVPLLLVTGAWDDILTVAGARLLMDKLCVVAATGCTGPHPREWVLLDRLVHNFEIFSPRALSATWKWAFPDLSAAPSLASWRIIFWLLILLGIFLSLLGLLSLAGSSFPVQKQITGMRVTNPRRLVWGKLWLWLLALPLVALVMFLYTLIPLPAPTFNLIYSGFLGGYGLLMLLLYLTGRMPGVYGNLRQLKINAASRKYGWPLALGFNLIFFTVVTIFFRSGLGLAPPVGVRFAWILIFLPLTAVSFWLGALEGELLTVSIPKKFGYRMWAQLVGLFPFYLYLALMVALGSISGLLAGMIGLLVLFASLLQAEVNRQLTGNLLFTAVLQSLFIFWLILPAGAMFNPLSF